MRPKAGVSVLILVALAGCRVGAEPTSVRITAFPFSCVGIAQLDGAVLTNLFETTLVNAQDFRVIDQVDLLAFVPNRANYGYTCRGGRAVPQDAGSIPATSMGPNYSFWT